jgi:hypothetical protein
MKIGTLGSPILSASVVDGWETTNVHAETENSPTEIARAPQLAAKDEVHQ